MSAESVASNAADTKAADDGQTRHAGRPRVYSDADIFAAVNLILKEGGFPHLTLEAIAREVGCTRQALVRRFGSKHGLVLAYLEFMLGYVEAEFQALGQEGAAPLATLRMRYCLPPDARFDMSGEPAVEANLLAFVLSVSTDPLYADSIDTLNHANIAAFQSLLDRAVSSGELRSCDTGGIAMSLHATWIGEIVHWCLDPTISLSSRLTRGFDFIVAPYQQAADGHKA